MKRVFKQSDITNALANEIYSELSLLEGMKKCCPNFDLRRINKIRSIQASLAMDGNKLTVEQILDLSDGSDVFAPSKDIYEAKNALEAYSNLSKIDFLDLRELLKFNQILMKYLMDEAGELRADNEKISNGFEIGEQESVSEYIEELLNSLKPIKYIGLFSISVFYYHFIVISPFKVGNGVTSRLWQKLLLMKYDPLFEFIPVEVFINRNQSEYYEALHNSEKIKESTPFVEFYFKVILEAIKDYAKMPKLRNDPLFRLESAKSHFGDQWFRRRDYLSLYDDISQSTSSRDLGYGVEESLLIHDGKHNQVKYKFMI